MNQSLQKLSNEQQHRIFSGAVLVSEAKEAITFYDTDTYTLTTSNRWLHRVNDTVRLDVPLTTISDIPSVHSQYLSITDADDIRKAVRVPDEHGDFALDLFDSGYSAFCFASVVRRRFQKGDALIELHSAEYTDTDFTYSFASVSHPDVPHDKTTLQKTQAVKSGIDMRIAAAYIQQERPEHYAVLVANHIVRL